MARYTGPVCRLCRREGGKLFLKGDRCYSTKCPIEKRFSPPGEKSRYRRKLSDYGVQLREKQKLRRMYGVLERPFRRYFARAARKKGVTGEALLQMLERRLDNVVYRMGLANSRPEARQLVRHGHFAVNGNKVDIPSCQLSEGDEVAVRDGSKKSDRFIQIKEGASARSFPDWLQVDADNLRGKVLRVPTREEIDAPVEEHLIVELYSR